MTEFTASSEQRMSKFVKLATEDLEGRAYNMSVQVYSTNEYITVQHNCFAFMFTNLGDTTATVGGMVVFPSATPGTAIGDSRSISGHKRDIYVGNMDLSFRAPVGVSPRVEIVQLYYIN